MFDGLEAQGKCTGKRLGNVRVNRANGRWQHDFGPQAPAKVCFQSPGGGVASGPTATLVTERTKKKMALAQQVQSAERLKAQLLQEFEELEEMEAEENRQ